ncbi:Uncharacterised protein [Helicobacter fennelliae]|uniref:Uncharacterized protein n=1 Tax=Helicobacter fennelliae TaxID=215 RepID=A0A2X3BCL4_9HELI|nr:hypothetical protein [Helicobacter fennelliae]SQB98353.1 Uncharacterised protein [Helicobacter fennelliae]
MQYFVTIYIDTIKPKLGLIPFTIPHAFLGLTHIHPDKLDEIDRQTKQEKLNNVDWQDFDTQWHDINYPSILNDEFVEEGFWGFAPVESASTHYGKVFENNQYKPNWDSGLQKYTYSEKRDSTSFLSQNRCVFEISKEQYEKLLKFIKADVSETSYRTPRLPQRSSLLYYTKELLYYNSKPTNTYPYHNCVTWVLNKLDSIGIEIIDNEEWLPDNISTRDSLLRKFHYLQYLYAVFRKFQKIDSNLESIAGAKAFRTWARSMTQNKIFCALKIEGDITKGLNISTECKRTITQNQKYYENKLKDFITKSSDFMRVYNRINEQLERLLTKVKNLGYTNIQGDFTFIMWNDELQTRMLLDSKHRDENTKDYIAYPIEQIDPNIPACNWTLNHNASFILILRDEMLCRAVYKNYHYSNMSESFIDSINKSHIAILSGNDDLSYWSKSLHALRKSVVCEE